MYSKAVDLSGMWDFLFLPAPVENFSVTELAFDSFAPVPGCFDMLPDYWLRRGTGVYRRTVEAGGNVALTLEGLGLRAEIFWDKKSVGTIDCAFSYRTLRFDAGEKGQHELIIAVNNEFDDTSSSMFCRNYDFYAHGGIYRNVSIREIGEFDLEYLKVIPLDAAAGLVEVELQLWGNAAACTEAMISFDDKADATVCKLQNGSLISTLQVPSPKLWSPEEPNLHRIQVKINDEVFESEFGLRTVELRDGHIYLNNKKLFLVGVNRHDAHPDFGYAVPKSIQIQDLQMLKKAGFNCIRGSHYPQSNDFLSMCDRTGMLVWEESLGWGNQERYMTDEGFQQKQLRETEIMARKSINHPCIIIWGFLNECVSQLDTSRPLIKSLADMLHKVDPSRPVTYATYRMQNDRCLDLADIISFNTYPGWYNCGEEQFIATEAIGKHLDELAEFTSSDEYKDKPLFISEIGAEAMPGFHGGQRWSEEYQADLQEFVLQHLMKHPRYSGVWFWQYCDARTYVSNASQNRPMGFNFKGLVDGHRHPKMAWRRLSEILKKNK